MCVCQCMHFGCQDLHSLRSIPVQQLFTAHILHSWQYNSHTHTNTHSHTQSCTHQMCSLTHTHTHSHTQTHTHILACVNVLGHCHRLSSFLNVYVPMNEDRLDISLVFHFHSHSSLIPFFYFIFNGQTCCPLLWVLQLQLIYI